MKTTETSKREVGILLWNAEIDDETAAKTNEK